MYDQIVIKADTSLKSLTGDVFRKHKAERLKESTAAVLSISQTHCWIVGIVPWVRPCVRDQHW